MEAIFLVLLGVLVLLLIISIGLLCIPIRICINLDTACTPPINIKMALCGGLFPEFPINGKGSKKGTQKNTAAAKKPDKSTYGGTIKYTPHIFKATARLISRVFKQIKLEKINADIVFGLPDPADTGSFYGLLTPFLLIADIPKTSNIALRPNFSEAVFAGSGHLAARLWPIALVLPILSFIWRAFISPKVMEKFR